MPPLFLGRSGRQAQILAAPHNQVKVLAQLPSAAIVEAVQTATDWTFSPFDIGRVIEGTDSSPHTYTIPFHTSAAFPIGAVIEVFQAGTGQITIAAAGGVTLLSPYSLMTALQYATIGLRQRSLDTWVLDGDLQ